MKRKILAVGSIHLNVRTNSDAGIDYEPGGEAFNFSLIMSSRSSIPVRLMTAMKPGGINRILKQSIEMSGTEAWITWDDSLPQGGNFKFMMGDLEEYSHSVTPVDRAGFSKEIMERALQVAHMIYLDTNLNSRVLRVFSEMAFDRGIPIVVMCSDTGKAHRISETLPYADLVVLSTEEWDSLLPVCPVIVAESSFRTLFLRYDGKRIDVLRIDAPERPLLSIAVPDDTPSLSWIRARDIIASEISRLVFVEGKVLSTAIGETFGNVLAIERDLMRYIRGFHSIDRLVGEVHDLAEIDGTTQAFSKTSIIDYLKRTLRQSGGKTGSVMIFLDLNRFKAVNDQLGHEEGDRILRDVVALTQKHIRIEVDRIGRYGGDEFLIVIPDIVSPSDNIASIRNEIHARFSRIPWPELCPEIPGFGVSIGVTVIFRESDIQDSIVMADRAMYEHKNRLKSGADR